MTKYFKIQKAFYKWFAEPKFFPQKIGQKWQQSCFVAAILPTTEQKELAEHTKHACKTSFFDSHLAHLKEIVIPTNSEVAGVTM